MDYEKQALDYHKSSPHGKIGIKLVKPLDTQDDLSLAYSPGVAGPCRKINKSPLDSYLYTGKGNLVCVITNGSAVLGLGSIGPQAAKPVMEGKAMLFKKFADIDVFDIEVETKDADSFIEVVKSLEPTFGGINLEDIKAPECFYIEEKLRESMSIPVFHDDQHGTAIIAAAALVNAIEITKRSFKSVKVVINGAGAAAIACGNLLKLLGVNPKNMLMCDSKGVLTSKRTDLNPYKKNFARDTPHSTLLDAITGADVFIGVSVKGALGPEHLKKMAANPIVFALANPDPEIEPKLAKDTRSDVIIATGRSDYPNQVNNLIGFPYIFRGALDVRAKTINEEMKVAAANAIASLARERVPDEVVAAMGGDRPTYGKEYIIPSTFDPRLISVIPVAVAKAAIKSGVARKKIKNFDIYTEQLKQRLDPSVTIMQGINSQIKKTQKRIVFTDGEDQNTLKAAIAFKKNGLGIPILVAKEKAVKEMLKEIGYSENFDIEIVNSKSKEKIEKYSKYIFKKLHGDKGELEPDVYELYSRDCDKLIKKDRVVWGSCMVSCGDADAMVTGNTRRYGQSLDKVLKVVDSRPGEIMFGLNMIINKGRTIFIGDTSVHEYPSSEQMAEIAISAARVVRLFGFTPKVAFLSHSTFGQPITSRTKHIRDAVDILKQKKVDFKFDGDMQPDVALNDEYKELYPFSEIVGNANVLIMPGQHSAAISYKIMKTLGDTKVIGPLLIGLGEAIEIAPLRSSTSEILNLASVAAYSSSVINYKKN